MKMMSATNNDLFTPTSHHDVGNNTPSSPSPGKISITTTTIELLTVDITAITFGYLNWKDILQARVTCKKFKESSLLTLVPLSDTIRHGRILPEFCVHSTRACGASLDAMTRALPNLQQICFYNADNAEDVSNNDLCITSNEVDVIARFRKLQSLILSHIRLEDGNNIHHPTLFGCPHLRKLRLSNVEGLELDLEELSSSDGCLLPLLEDLYCDNLEHLRGDIKSLASFKDTLKNITMKACPKIHGDFMVLADFPNLETIFMRNLPLVGGDARHITDGNFPILRRLSLPTSVYGFGSLGCIADAPEVMNVLYHRLIKRNGTQVDFTRFRYLSQDSPDHYDIDIFSLLVPPFRIEFVEAGRSRRRFGWRWNNGQNHGSCETIWFENREPENMDADEEEKYIRDLEFIRQDVVSYRGFFIPPTNEEYQRMSTHW